MIHAYENMIILHVCTFGFSTSQLIMSHFCSLLIHFKSQGLFPLFPNQTRSTGGWLDRSMRRMKCCCGWLVGGTRRTRGSVSWLDGVTRRKRGGGNWLSSRNRTRGISGWLSGGTQRRECCGGWMGGCGIWLDGGTRMMRGVGDWLSIGISGPDNGGW